MAGYQKLAAFLKQRPQDASSEAQFEEEGDEEDDVEESLDRVEREEGTGSVSGNYQNLISFLRSTPDLEGGGGHNLRPRLPRGREVKNLSGLTTNSDTFVRLQTDSPSIETVIRKTDDKVVSNLFIQTSSFEVDFIPTRGAAAQRHLFTLIDIIKSLLEEMYEYIMGLRTNSQNQPEVQMTIGSKKLKPHLGSGIYPLVMENRDAIVNELLWQLLHYSQSNTRTITLDDLYLTFTIGDTRLGGHGQYLPLRRYYKKKRFCALSNVGSILLVESQELCFFVAIYYSRCYNTITERIKGSTNISEKKRLRRTLNEILTSNEAVKRTKHFFQQLQLDITSLPPGELSTMILIGAALDCTISILDEGSRYKKVLSTATEVDPIRPHIVLLRVALLEGKKPTPTGVVKALSVHHFHGVRTVQAVLASQKLYWCEVCGVAMASNSRHRHLKECLGPLEHCPSCRRPVMGREKYVFVKGERRAEFCIKTSDNEKLCDQLGCKVVSQGPQCLAIHQEHCTAHICPKCEQPVGIKGKYIEMLKKQKKKAKRGQPVVISHTDCLEVYCGCCDSHFNLENLDIKRDESHCCFMQALKKANTWGPPCSLDMETREEPGTRQFVVNTICFISPVEEPSEQFRQFECRVFSEVRPDEPYNGVPLGQPFPVPIEGQDTWLTPELCQFEEKERQRGDGDGDSDSELLTMNPDLLKTIHSVGGRGRESPEMGRQSEVSPPNRLSDTESVEDNSAQFQTGHFGTARDARSQLDDIVSRLQTSSAKHLPPIDECDFNLNAQQARPSESSADEEEETVRPSRRRKRRRRCDFIDDMAQASSGSCLEDESDEDPINIDPPIPRPGCKRARVEIQCLKNPSIVRPKSKRRIIPCQSSSSESEESSLGPNSPQPPDNTSSSAPTSISTPHLSNSILDPPTQVEFGHVHEVGEESVLLEADKKIIEEATPYCEHETIVEARERIRRSFLETRRYQAQAEESRYPVLDNFFGWLYEAKHLRGSVVLCHYGRRFDSILLSEYMTTAGFPFKVIEVANSLIGLTILGLNVIVLDFYSYLSCALSKLPKHLGLSLDCKKGYFPHKINLIQNYHLNLPHCPDRELYQEWKMSEERRIEFDLWFRSIRNETFDFRTQLLDYCVQDTKVLHAAILKFANTCLRQELEIARSYDSGELNNFSGGNRRVFLGDGISGYPKAIYPFSKQSWTLSGYASLVMAKLAVPHFPRMPILKHEDEEIGMQRSSQEEMVFLLYMKMSEYPNLEFGLTNQTQRSFVCVDREQTPPRTHTFWVDGYDPITRTVIEYLGCLWHGHLRSDCYTPTTRSHGGFSLGEARARTEKRLQLLKNHKDIGRIEVYHSCRWKKFLAQNPDLKKGLVDACGRCQPLNLRSVFRGGVVACFSAYFESSEIAKYSQQVFGRPPLEGGLGMFLDFASFYPSLLSSIKTGYFEREEDRIKLPYGPPTRVRTHDLCMEACPPSRWKSLVGAASVRVLPPTHQRFPILRLDIVRNNQPTQMAALCRSCAESASFLDGANCRHSDNERAITGSFTFLELVYALEVQQYKLEEVYELHFYENYCTDYLEKFLETCAHMKVVSEGFPQDVNTPEQKENFVQELSRDTGLPISVEDIRESPSMRSNGKILMNAQVGKTGQKIVRDSKHYVQDYHTMAKLRCDQTLKIKSYHVVSDTTVKVTTETEKALAQPFKRGNLLIAAQCTAASRRELIRHLTLLEENHYAVCYSDTDSFLVVPLHADCPPIRELVRVGSRLGSLKVEHSGILSYTGLLKKAYVFSKKLEPQQPQDTSSQGEEAEPTVNGDASAEEGSCHVLAMANQPLYPPAQPGNPTEDVHIKFKGISQLSAILKANEAAGIIKQELLDVLAQNSKPDILIEQDRMRLNQGGKIGIWGSDPEKSFKRMAMSNSSRYFDLKNCVSIVEEENSDTEDDDTEMREEIKFGLKGSVRQGIAPKRRRQIQVGPILLTQPFGYRPTEEDQNSSVGKILTQWRKSLKP